MTRQELEAMGLSEEEIKAILGAEDSAGSGATLPFPQLKINYDMDLGKLGDFGYNPIKNEDGVVEEYEKVFKQPTKIRVLKQMFQYSKYDGEKGKPVVTSNIVPLSKIKEAVDLKTGIPIAELQDEIQDIKAQKILLIEITEDGEKYYAVWYQKGKYQFEFSDFMKKAGEGAVLQTYYNVTNKKQKKGSVTYFVPEIEIEKVSKEDFIKNIKSDAEKIKKFDEWINQVNSQVKPSTPSKISADDVDEDIEVDF